MNETVDTSHSMIDALASGKDEDFEEGFRKFCLSYHLVIRRWCKKWFSSESDADDAAQAMLISLRKRLKKYQSKDGVRFRNWLSRVCKRLAIDVIRKHAREKQLLADIPDMDSAEAGFVADLFLDFERRDFLKHALRSKDLQISSKDRSVLELYLVEAPSGEIATSLEMSPNAIHQAMHRIRNAIKGRMEDYLVKAGLEISDLFPD